jgi:hypothetical protein
MKIRIRSLFTATASLLIGAAVLTPTASVRADTITTFDVSGTCLPGSPPFTGTTFGGTLTVDVTAGTLTSIDLTFQGLSPFTDITLSTPFGNQWTVVAVNGVLAYGMFLDFSTGHTPGSLVGFTGGTIDDGLVHQISTGNIAYTVTGGSITASVADGGSSLALLSVSLLCLLHVRQRCGMHGNQRFT